MCGREKNDLQRWAETAGHKKMAGLHLEEKGHFKK
jgi:hypothetical protein